MFSTGIINAFTDDPTVRLIGVLVVLDFVLGVLAAIKTQSFRLSYIADVFRNDVLGKVFPYYALWGAVHVTGIDWSVGGFDVIEETAGAVVIGAMIGSALNSLRDLGLLGNAPNAVAGPDPVALGPAPNSESQVA